MNDLTTAKIINAQRPQSEEKVSKQPYSSPRLIEYGDLLELTAGLAGSGLDGMSGMSRA